MEDAHPSGTGSPADKQSPAAGEPGPDAEDPGPAGLTADPAVDDGRPRWTRPARHVNPGLAVSVALGIMLGLLLHEMVVGIIVRVRGLLITLLVSLFLSFAMEPAVQWLARRGVRRGMGTMLVFLAAGVMAAGFIASMVPLIIDQAGNLIDAAPGVVDNLAERAQSLPGGLGDGVSDWLEEAKETLPEQLPGVASNLAGGVIGLGSTLLGGILNLLTTLLVTFYLVADGPRLRRALVSRLDPVDQRDLLGWWELAIKKTGGYVYSRALTAVASAAFHSIAFSVIGIPYATALGIWVGIVSSLIPVIGTYFAGALPLLIALADEPFDALWVLIAVIVYQQVENYLVVPRITAVTLELHPAVAFLSVLAGGALLGATGALLALPAAAIATALVSAYGERHELPAHELLADLEPKHAR